MTPEAQLRLLMDRAEIGDVMHNYATGLDRRDWALYRSVFTDEFVNYSASGEAERWTADEWVEHWQPVFEGYDATQHFMANHTFTIKGDEATCVTYMRARHVLLTAGGVSVYTMGGYYTCDFVRTADGWKMSVRRLTTTWFEGERGLSEQARERGRRKLGLA